MNEQEELRNAKRRLCRLLLRKDMADFTDAEMELALALMKDVDIQSAIRERFHELRKERQ